MCLAIDLHQHGQTWPAVGFCHERWGNIEIGKLARRFAELCPGKVFSLEIINTRSPRIFPYWKEGFWDHYRDVPGWVFTQFLRRARSGEPYRNVPPGPAGTAADSAGFKRFLVDQERLDIEQAVAYCKTELGLGTA